MSDDAECFLFILSLLRKTIRATLFPFFKINCLLPVLSFNFLTLIRPKPLSFRPIVKCNNTLSHLTSSNNQYTLRNFFERSFKRMKVRDFDAGFF